MGAVADNIPVIIGVGQFSERPQDEGYCALSHMDLAGRAMAEAIDDCRAGGDVAAAIDTIGAIRQFENSTPIAEVPFGGSNNPPRSIGKRAGADPARAILEITGGQGNQKLVGEFATDIAEGRSELAAIVGAEAISTVLTLTARGETPDWSESVGGTIEDRGYGVSGMFDKPLLQHGVRAPIPAYALLDNARRARLGLSPDAYRMEIGKLFAPFSEVAMDNPYAASRERHSAEELATVTGRNRIVAEPYARMTVARDQVNQAAAILIASAAKARALGVPEHRWVHIQAVTNAAELSPMARPDLATSPASIASIEAALAIAGIGFDDLDYIDLYSCFAIPVFNVIDAFGLAADDPRGLTLTGGLPFFGGAGNNYSAHAIAEAVQRVRGNPGSHALVGANGGVMSKYATGIYSTRPADWTGQSRWRTIDYEQTPLVVIDTYSGEAVIDSYTLMPDKQSKLGIVVAHTPMGERLAANVVDEVGLELLEVGDVIGRAVFIETDDAGRNIATCGSGD